MIISLFIMIWNMMKKQKNGILGTFLMLHAVFSTAPYVPTTPTQSVILTALDNMLIDRNNMNIYIDMMNRNYGGLMSVISCC